MNAKQLPIDYEKTQIGTGFRTFGNPNPGGKTSKQKVKLFADGTDEYTYRDKEWGKVTVRTWPNGRKHIRTEGTHEQRTAPG